MVKTRLAEWAMRKDTKFMAENQNQGPTNRGSASIDEDREIASDRGNAAQEAGGGEEAGEAGRKGGQSRGQNEKSLEQEEDQAGDQNRAGTPGYRGGTREQQVTPGRQGRQDQ
jgi:hypothetical protein